MSSTPLTEHDHVVNPELIKQAREIFKRRFQGLAKTAFVPGGDPGMSGAPPGGAPPPGGDPSGGMGGMPGMPPGGDPSGGMPPGGGDPSGGMGGMPPGGDPSGGMGMPPPGGGGGGGGGADPALSAKLDQILQALQGGGVGAQSGMTQAGGIKPKIDVNVAIMQLSKMVARIADALHIPIPASEMIATPTDLNAIASKQQNQGQQDAAMGPPGGIPPMGGMPDMSAGPGKTGGDRFSRGEAFDHTGLGEVTNKAAAIIRMRRARAKAS